MGQLSPNAMNVQGTGQNVGQLKDLGWDKDQISQMGQATPNAWQNLTKGALTGLGQGLQSYGSSQRKNNPFWGGYGPGGQ